MEGKKREFSISFECPQITSTEEKSLIPKMSIGGSFLLQSPHSPITLTTKPFHPFLYILFLESVSLLSIGSTKQKSYQASLNMSICNKILKPNSAFLCYFNMARYIDFTILYYLTCRKVNLQVALYPTSTDDNCYKYV